MASPAPETAPEVPLWRARWSARAWLWHESHIPRVQRCGRTPQSVAQPVEFYRYPSASIPGPDGKQRSVGGQVSLGGVQHCMSVWACPICSARAMSLRAQQLQAVVDGWHAEGHRIGFVTLTIRHTAAMPGSEVWDKLMGAWGKTIAGTAWTRFQRKYGVAMPGRRKHLDTCPIKTNQEPMVALGPVERGCSAVYAPRDSVSDCECPRPVARRVPTVRTVEALQGYHGWHMHLHVLVFFDGTGGDDAVNQRWADISSWLIERWENCVTSVGARVDVEKGTDTELIDPRQDSTTRIAQYLSKAVYDGSGARSAIHREMAGGVGKRGRNGNRTPWQLLDDAAAGDFYAAKKWHEWEHMSRGRRQMWITGALLDRYGVRDLSDSEAVEMADDRAEDWIPTDNSPLCQNVRVLGPAQRVASFPRLAWRSLPLHEELLEVVAAAADPGGLAAWLSSLGLSFVSDRCRNTMPWDVTLSTPEWRSSSPG